MTRLLDPEGIANVALTKGERADVRGIAAMIREYERSRDTLQLVLEFHERFRQDVRDRPEPSPQEPALQVVADRLRDLSVKMLGIHQNRGGEGPYLRAHLHLEELAEFLGAIALADLPGQLDALTDMQYVLDGSYLTMGMGRYKRPAFDAVHAANMRKIVPASPQERIRKPDEWVAPDMARIMGEADDEG